MFKFYDSPNDWRGFIDEIYWINDKEIVIKFHPSLFAHNKKMYLLQSKKSDVFGGVKVIFNVPNDSEINKYEKMH